jgi:predicted metal-dependent phosphoesterase TrpH
VYKADFHTHTKESPDGALRLSHYRRMLEKRRLDVIAITDHNVTEYAKQVHAELGDRIIVGEEITTSEGEIIGLYLTKTIPPYLSVMQTIAEIHKQGGLVYIPHPFETIRKGLSHALLDSIAQHVDIIEVHNGRAMLQDRSEAALSWASSHGVAGAASSDAHGLGGWGRTYSMLHAMPTRDTLTQLLASAEYEVGFPGVGMLYPRLNRVRKWKWNV